ncbi:zonular occludens toxin domain-containing protein [Clostridium gasigenes]|uniref:zonular occludens toxin domain-containing protein n=1 Tax=Clostridium gasigenes TaxID=94869 RepID=UPI001C0C0E5C|nr:zonular occludens toxin domain-containing protein [Clostridium gasigenes]MBU3134626.1 zonular occludens toxin domain-containing protein [Clostridium gasigenes]
MIYMYTGTPGSGKSLHSIKDIMLKIKRGGNVICNFPVAYDKIKIGKKFKRGEFVYKDNKDLTTDFLYQYAFKNHTKGKEGQTLIVLDEAQSLFNPRDYRDVNRKDFNHFFSLHRHLGYNVILITQNDRLLDRQIRCLVEYEVKHRKINNFKTLGALLPFKTFACVNYWYGVNEKLGVELFTYRKMYSDLYDSYALFDNVLKKEDEESALA